MLGGACRAGLAIATGVTVVLALVACADLFGAGITQHHRKALSYQGLEGRIVLDVRRSRPGSSGLFGIFFEEIYHAGEGGLYAELIQDRSFEGLAFTEQFLDSQQQEHEISHPLDDPDRLSYDGIWGRREGLQLRSWFPKMGTTLQLSKADPINKDNPVAMVLRGSEGHCGLLSTGFWGVPVLSGATYHLSLYLRNPSQELQAANLTVTAALESANGTAKYAAVTFAHVTTEWALYTAELAANATDTGAVLSITATGCTTLAVDMVSLFPAANGPRGKASPFRQDLLQLLKHLEPGFLRFPGGCYVEGTLMKNAFWWKPSVGPIEHRPGHWNGMWEYWSTDGLGLYEYMLLAEELNAEPIWVMNNGLAHVDAVDTAHILGLVQDALDSVEFMTGPATSRWGAVRAAMGHPAPWNLTYFAIGNEDCGKPFYEGNYIAFASALRMRYPHLQLIANCDMANSAPQDLYDWHWYTAEDPMFNGRYTFDLFPRDAPVFVSEYAVYDHGISTKPAGNLGGAIAEAGFMTGMERNADVVKLAAFAPLLQNANDSAAGGGMCPTSMVMYDNHRAVTTPSYHIQRLFAKNGGPRLVDTSIVTPTGQEALAASTTCLDDLCNELACKLVNYAQETRQVEVDVRNLSSRLAVNITTVTGAGFYDSNSFDHPDLITPKTSALSQSASVLQLQLPPLSLTVLNIAEDAQSYSGHASSQLRASAVSRDVTFSR